MIGRRPSRPIAADLAEERKDRCFETGNLGHLHTEELVRFSADVEAGVAMSQLPPRLLRVPVPFLAVGRQQFLNGIASRLELGPSPFDRLITGDDVLQVDAV